MNGSFATGYFDIKRGVRQGNLLPPYLSILAIEILATEGRNNEVILGVNIGGIEVRQDDMTIFVRKKQSVE